MSTTLIWASSGNGIKTGTGNAELIDDLDTLIATKAGDSSFFWEKAGKSNSGTPRYLLLRRKDGSAGRFALVIWDSPPADFNTAIMDTYPTSNYVQLILFPAGTGTALSNLTAPSGTVCGDDTGVVKCTSMGPASTLNQVNYVPFYFDSAEALIICFGDPGASTIYAGLIGKIIVDAADVAYDAISGPGSQFGNSFAPSFAPWTTAKPQAGASQGNFVRTNYGSPNRLYFRGVTPTGNWANANPGADDLLSDTGANKAYFVAVQLLGTTRGEGFVLKLRQIAYGTGSVGPFTVYNTTGPVVAARQVCQANAGATGCPWLTNFKL